MLRVNFSMHCLQRPPVAEELDEWIIQQYRAMHDAFFNERELIPFGHYYELSFEELESDPVGQVERIYEALALSEFAKAQHALERYVGGISGYRKNRFPEL